MMDYNKYFLQTIWSMEPQSYLDLDFFEDDHREPIIYLHDDYPRPQIDDYITIFHNFSIFGVNNQEDPSKTHTDNSSSDSRKLKKTRSSDNAIFYDDGDGESHQVSASPNFPIISGSEENMDTEEKDSGLPHSIDQPILQPLKKKKKSSYIRKRSQPPKKKNEYKSKNLLSFLWTKTVNYLQDNIQTSTLGWWQQQKAKTGSRNQFNFLFLLENEEVQECMRQMFNERYFYRMVMLSSIDAPKKKIYIQYIRTLYKCYQRKFMPWIN